MSTVRYAILQIGAFALAAVVYFLLREHAVEVALVFGVAALAAPILWLIVSSLRPAFPDRTCPKCGKHTLRLLVPGEKTGVRCPACGFRDKELYVPFLIDVDDDL
ncbi:hypothetical protein HY251_10565 [bacterium]|nr:hypothetical protein [bacterium]